jgi:hypothetical protein
MTFVVGIALEWLGVGSLVAVAVLTEHLRSASRFPGRASLWLIPALIVAWPWPAWVWYATRNTRTHRMGRAHGIGLVTIVLVGALGLGWVCGSNLYTLLYEPERTDKAAIDAMIERIVYAEPNGNSNSKHEHLDETGVELILAPPARSRRGAGQNENPRTASGSGTNP